MHAGTLEILRCPYCGGRLRLSSSYTLRRDGDNITDAILTCHCSKFPVVAGIPVMTVEGIADMARDRLERGLPEEAVRAMFAFEDDEQRERFEAVTTSAAATYRDALDALGHDLPEDRYFLYRFSDPTFVMAEAVARVLGNIVLGAGDRALDLCGGSGHLTRTLMSREGSAAVLMDLAFPNLWLARRFTAAGCEAVCADAHSVLPFASHTFGLTICSDAIHYIWTKRLLANEMARLMTRGGAIAITHAHNAGRSNISEGLPLPSEGYRALFEEDGIDARVFAERSLLTDIVSGHLDLSRRHEPADLMADEAVTVIATVREDVFADRRLVPATVVRGELRLNPLYDVTYDDGHVTLQLRFPSAGYEQEYRQCRLYLPETARVERAMVSAALAGTSAEDPDDLRARRIVLDLPQHYL